MDKVLQGVASLGSERPEKHNSGIPKIRYQSMSCLVWYAIEWWYTWRTQTCLLKMPCGSSADKTQDKRRQPEIRSSPGKATRPKKFLRKVRGPNAQPFKKNQVKNKPYLVYRIRPQTDTPHSPPATYDLAKTEFQENELGQLQAGLEEQTEFRPDQIPYQGQSGNCRVMLKPQYTGWAILTYLESFPKHYNKSLNLFLSAKSSPFKHASGRTSRKAIPSMLVQ
ncbi:hypothetical protein EAG_04262 [Camponotus floridanus]|uniref:Uncharacterized protein n=1 Tax=Camponotus floridanus TaxID=104421 RepID=E2AN28_CAMFO|nr:hypothetical protein EAG_04262 [Camponotus floridanus]